MGGTPHDGSSGDPGGVAVSGASLQCGSDDGENAGPSRRSLRGLDALMADVREGVGPYLAMFLKGSEHWDAGAIGIDTATSNVAAALCEVSVGLLVDGSRAKRLLVAASGLLVAAGCLLIVLDPRYFAVLAGQAMLGAASAVIPPAIAALSLGLVGRRLLDARVSRNEGFNHTGNFTAALLAGGLGTYFGYAWIFFLVGGLAVASAVVVNVVNPAEINHDRACGGEAAGGGAPLPIQDVLRRRDLQVFLAAVVLFHFCNAAMLPMAGQVLAQTHPGTEALALSACIITAKAVMVGVAWAVGRVSKAGIGRKPVFLVALAVLPVRGVLFSFTTGPYGVVAIQLLNGVAADIFGVISVLVAADLMRGAGRFNLAQGLVALANDVRAASSNGTAGYIVEWFGYPAGFLYLTAIAGCALVFFALLMLETRQAGADAAGPAGAARPAAT